jgi:uncharacterized protein (TIGR03067 family)
MRPTTFAVLFGAVALATGCGKKDEPSSGGADDKARVQGSWVVTRVELPETDAKTQSKIGEEIQNIQVTVKDGTITATIPREREPGYATFTFDPSKSPKEVDFTETDKEGRKSERADATMPGIYKLDGDTIVIAVQIEKGGPRPNDFKPSASPDKKGGVIVVHAKKQ